MKKQKIKVLFFYSSTCVSCEIMRRNLLESLNKSDVDYDFHEISNLDSARKDFMKEHKISDFPTTIFYKGEKMIDKVVGSIAVFEILRIIASVIAVDNL